MATKLTPTQRAVLADNIRSLRVDLLRMQRALERDDELSDFQASGAFNSATHRWRTVVRAFVTSEAPNQP